MGGAHMVRYLLGAWLLWDCHSSSQPPEETAGMRGWVQIWEEVPEDTLLP